MVKIDVYSICWNEMIMLPYFLKHYKKYARKITVYDNFSNDESVKFMQDNDVEVIPFDTGGKLIETTQVDIRNNCWKGSDADWVIVCDIDEFVYHSDLIEYLSNTSYTHLFGRGYEMMSEQIPTTSGQIYDEIKIGYPIDEFMSYKTYPYWKSNYSKGIIFKPSEIFETNFGLGSHYCKPIGNVKTNVESLPDEVNVKYPVVLDDLKLLHYKYLSREYVIQRNITNRATNGGDWKNEIELTTEIYKQYDAWLPFCKKVID